MNFNLRTIYVTNLHFKGGQHLDSYCFTRRIEFWNFFVTKTSLTFCIIIPGNFSKQTEHVGDSIEDISR